MMDRQMDGGVNNISIAFLKKCGNILFQHFYCEKHDDATIDE